MQTKDNIRKIIILPLLMLILVSCMKKHSLEITPINYGNIIISFNHEVAGNSLKLDTMIYHTSLGNNYKVTDLQYFISHLALHSPGGKWRYFETGKGIHYIDARDIYSCSWWLNDLIPSGTYDSVSFTFGLDEKQNLSGRFPDPPERDMSWPDALGGGYHYMKMNLKWKNSTMTQDSPFNFHLGIGQVYAGNTTNADSIIGFIQNYFRVSLPCKLEITKASVNQVLLQMNIDRWFDGVYAFDFSEYPYGIMQNEEGMFKGCQNGRHAFAVKITN